MKKTERKEAERLKVVKLSTIPKSPPTSDTMRFDDVAKTFDLYPDGHYTKGHPYVIPLSECSRDDQMLAWILHLCGKTWWTTDLTRNFLMLWRQVVAKEGRLI